MDRRKFAVGMAATAICAAYEARAAPKGGRRRAPDLVIDTLQWSADLGQTWNQDAVQDGAEILFRATVRNTGNTGTAGTIRVDFEVAGELVGSASTAGGLPRGASVVMGTTDTYQALAGAHQVTAIVDPQNMLGERNEGNNTTQGQLVGEAPQDQVVAVDDTAPTRVNETINIDVLANDVAPPGVVLVISFLQSPTAQGGTAILAADGRTVVYTPPQDFQGEDSFQYEVQAA